MTVTPDYDDEPDDPWDCYQCGGEGFVWDCFDGFCVNAEDGCDDCTRPCPECARRKRDNQPTPDAQALSDVLADALLPNKQEEGNDVSETIELTEAATNVLRELAISGPGVPGPEEVEELIAHGLIARVVKITPAGELVAETIPGFRKAQMAHAIAKAKECVASMEANAADDCTPQAALTQTTNPGE